MAAIVEWTYKGKEIHSVSDMPEWAYGFAYIIIFANGMKYVGKKAIYSQRKIKNKKVIRETDWRRYKGSCSMCKKLEPIKREIIEFAKSKAELTYLEARHLFILDVLRNDIYLNNNIDGRYFRRWL